MDGGRERGRGLGWGGGACEMFQFRSRSLEFSQPVLSSDLMSATDAPGRSCERGERDRVEKKEPKAPLKRRVAALRSRFAATRATLAKGHFEGMYQTVRGYCPLGRL